MKNFRYIFLLTILFSFNFACKKPALDSKPTAILPDQVVINKDFLRVDGIKIIDKNNQSIWLKGIAFGNEVWTDKEVPNTHHGEVDYGRVKAMGMNAIRFYINYKTFENDNNPYVYKQTGWDWLDQNVAWAKKNGIYLIINMHVPQGGFQSQGTSPELWTVAKNQDRLSALWKAIADKYKNEPQIIGFGLVNEPVPTTSKMQWEQLAQKITTSIRSVDKNHILFIEKPIYVKGQDTEDSDFNFPKISDNNVVYEFHTYEPYYFTHQLLDWAYNADGGSYPDETRINIDGAEWYTATFNNPTIPSGDTKWQFFEGVKYKISDLKIAVGVPALIGAGVSGRVYFDNIIVKEYDASGVFTKNIFNLNLDSQEGWSFWSSNNKGTSGLSTTEGYDDAKSLYIEGATADCNFANYQKGFLAKQGYSYQISGYMKGEKVAMAAACKLRIDFLSSKTPIYGRGKQYMEYNIKKYLDWGKAKNVPVYMGEFGANINCFKNNKGGLQFVSDIIDINKAENIHFTYHTYHEDTFGLYFGYGFLPDPTKTNQDLIELFKKKLN
jgi:endoglucanase